MSVTFSKDQSTVTLPNPTPGLEAGHVKHQAVGRAASGELYAYDKGVQGYTVDLTFAALTDEQKSDLMTFFHTVANGVMNAFTCTDPGGNPFTARFARPEIALRKVAQNIWEATLALELNEMAR